MLKDTRSSEISVAKIALAAVRLLSYLLPVAIVGAGIAGYLALVSKPPISSDRAADPLPPLVETETIVPHEGVLDMQVDGLVVPHREVDVAVQVGGQVTNKAEECEAGRFVEQGTLLFQIDPRDYELEIRRLTAMLEQADANLGELAVEAANTQRLITLAEEDQELAANELRRLENLSAGNFVSDSEIDRSKKTELVTRNTLASLNNQLQLFAARRKGLESGQALVASQLEKAQLDLSRTTVVAPVDGVIVSDIIEQNAIVQPGAVLAVIEDTTAVDVKCNLRMEELSWLRRQAASTGNTVPLPGSNYELPQTPVTVEYRYSGRRETVYRWQGVLSRFESVGLDEQTRTVPCRVLVDDPGQVTLDGPDDGRAAPPPPALVRGMYVTVVLHLEPATPLIRISELALRPGEEVWLARHGALARKSVRLIERMGDASDRGSAYWVADAIASGLRAGDKLIVSPLVVVTDGMSIREQTEDEVDRSLGDS